ncbi:MAG: FtsX-like permease family protein [Gemmatimonadales bacterium]|nr:FtsX-like permease family protein [Gemmatimonadales bacterium]MBP9199299.1 FtsX-like permease family protein [Gemmatimonadales bacterium]
MSRLGFVTRLAWRESRAAGRRMLLLTAAISIGVGALVAIESFTDNLQVAVEGQSRALLGGDLAVSARSAPSEAFRRTLDSLTLAAGADSVRDRASVTSFSGMAYVPRTAGTRLVQVNAITGGYPFYGVARTEPATAWARLATERVTLVDPAFLTSLGAQVGDTMALGEARFVIAGTVTSFPGDVGVRAAFGPRVYIPGALLAETGLLGFGARVEYEWFLRTPDTLDARAFGATWQPRIGAQQGRLRTAVEEEQDLKQFLDQLGRYLGLVALIALLLGGVGVGSAVQVFIKRKRDTIAVLRCLGATSGQVFGAYLLQAAVMGLLGSLAGVVLGVLLQLALPTVFGAFLPLDVTVVPSPGAIATGLGVGVWVAVVFALLPLLAVRRVPPLAVLRRDVEEGPGTRADRWMWLARAALAASVIGMAALQVGQLRQGAVFAAGIGTALLVLWLAAFGLTRALRRWFPHRLPYVARQGLANLYRPANQTVAVVLALGFGAFLLGALAVMQHNLLRQLQLDGGIGRPNLVFFDIQPDQRDDVLARIRAAGLEAQAPVPIVPMRLVAIKGKRVKDLLADTLHRAAGPDSAGRGARDRGPRDDITWALRREYRSTYRDAAVGSEKLVVGDWWAPGAGTAPGVVPLSLEVGIAGDLDVTIRDTLTWSIQGVEIPSVVTSLREVNWARFEPNFFAVFPAGPLDAAPQSFVVLTRVDDATVMGQVQRSIVERHPNVTSIDLTSIQKSIEQIVASVSLAIRFMALFSLATGVVVLVGALATSRYQRVREAALLKTLGATRRQVVRIMVTEYAALGLLAAVVATGLSTAGGWALMKWVFEVPFTVPWAGFAILATVLVALPVATGLWTSLDLFRRSPLAVLREE